MNRGIMIFCSLLAGLFFGLLAGAYIFIAWVPPEAILNNASPKYLNYDAANMSPQYRDFYLVRAANRYQRDLQQGVPDPLKGTYDILGVTTGDTSIDEAISMVRMSEKVATKENNLHGDLGQFTQNEELALGALASALESAKTASTYPKIDASKYPPSSARTGIRIIGLVLLAIFAIVAGLIMLWVDRMTKIKTVQLTPVILTGLHQQTPLEHEARVSPSTIQASQQQAGAITSPGTPLVTQTVNVMSTRSIIDTTETPLATFAPTVYRLGDDRYDESFTINGPVSELLGECGASIADRIGLDSPSKVSAISLWVFDKKDFQSTTKVLMTEYAWNDSVIRSKLKSRGEAVLAVDRGVIEILTTTLRVDVQVSDLHVNTEGNPQIGYFQNVALTFTVYKRSTVA